MLRFPVVLVRNILTLLAYLWSMFLYTVGYSLRRKKKLFVAWKPDASQSFGPPPGMASYFQATPSFLETWERVERLKASSDIDGLIMECDATAGGLGTTASLTAMVDRAREAFQEHPEYRDLQVLAHTRMTLLNDYLLATAADEIFVSPSSRLFTFGPRFDQVFAADRDITGIDSVCNSPLIFRQRVLGNGHLSHVQRQGFCDIVVQNVEVKQK